jgi:hypothetical protein
MIRQQRTGCQEEDNEDCSGYILRYNKDMYDEGMVHNNHPLIVYLPVYLIVIFFFKSCQSFVSS